MTDTASTVGGLPPGDAAGVVVSLVLIVAAIVALGWVYSRLQGLRGPRGRVLDVLATQPLGPKERVILARVGDKRLLIGITPVQMQTLCILEDGELPAPETATAVSFASRLRNAFGGEKS